jgi:hypothetical protein
MLSSGGTFTSPASATELGSPTFDGRANDLPRDNGPRAFRDDEGNVVLVYRDGNNVVVGRRNPTTGVWAKDTVSPVGMYDFKADADPASGRLVVAMLGGPDVRIYEGTTYAAADGAIVKNESAVANGAVDVAAGGEWVAAWDAPGNLVQSASCVDGYVTKDVTTTSASNGVSVAMTTNLETVVVHTGSVAGLLWNGFTREADGDSGAATPLAQAQEAGGVMAIASDYEGGAMTAAAKSDTNVIAYPYSSTAERPAATLCADTTPPPPPPPDNGNKRPTGISVLCTYVVAFSQDVCTATVGDAGPPPAVAPTGTVTFSSSKGGVFPAGNTCTLSASPSAPTAPSCSVQYIAPSGGGFPDVSAQYSGSSLHAPSSGSTKFIIAAGISGIDLGPRKPKFPKQLTLRTEVPVAGAFVQACSLGAGPKATNKASASDTETDLINKAQDLQRAQQRMADLLSNQQKLAGAARQHAILNAEIKETATVMAQSKAEIERVQNQIANPSPNPPPSPTGPPEPATPERLQDLMKKQKELFEQLAKTQKTINSICGGVLGKKSGGPEASSAAKRKRGKKGKRKRSNPPTRLGAVTKRNAPAGPLTLKLRLKPKLVKRIAAGKRKKTVYVFINMRLPSGLVKSGWPAGTVQKVTLRRK